MLLRNTASIFSVLIFTAFALGQIVDTSLKLICSPSDPSDCYPEVFEPSYEWQIIREGQHIPPGLHVRLNIATLQKEAKYVDPSEANSSGEIVVSQDQEDQDNKGDLDNKKEPETKEEVRQEVQKMVEELRNRLKGLKESAKQKVEARTSLDTYTDSVRIVKDFPTNSDVSDLDKAFDVLEDLSHDIEFGARMTLDNILFDNLLRITSNEIADPRHLEFKQRAYQIMASSLRNNPDASNNLLENQKPEFVEQLFEELSERKSGVTRKRVLGIIQGLAQNKYFASKYLNWNLKDSKMDVLISSFTSMSPESQGRVINIFEDLGMLDHDEIEKRSTLEPLAIFSNILQKRLYQNQANDEDEFRLLFQKLKEVHTENKDVKPSDEFIKWLADETEARKSKKKREEVSEQDAEYNRDFIIDAHEIFGNPKAARKALADYDEL